MISKKVFKEIITLVQKQNKREDRFADAVCKYIGSDCYWISDNYYYTALMKLLRETIDPYEYVEWWLYESTDDKKVIDADGTEYNLITIDSLYDFLIRNEVRK